MGVEVNIFGVICVLSWTFMQFVYGLVCSASSLIAVWFKSFALCYVLISCFVFF
jgi:hypothetical protein